MNKKEKLAHSKIGHFCGDFLTLWSISFSFSSSLIFKLSRKKRAKGGQESEKFSNMSALQKTSSNIFSKLEKNEVRFSGIFLGIGIIKLMHCNTWPVNVA